VLVLYLRERTRTLGETGKPRILHVAPEPSITPLLREVGGDQYVSVDLESHEADLRADLTALPFPDDSFDLIVCSHVLEHIEDDRLALRELARATARGGETIIVVPIKLPETFEDPAIRGPKERQRVFGQPDHVRVVGTDYIQRIRDAGFAVELRDYVEHLPRETIVRHGLVKGEPFYLCQK